MAKEQRSFQASDDDQRPKNRRKKRDREKESAHEWSPTREAMGKQNRRRGNVKEEEKE